MIPDSFLRGLPELCIDASSMIYLLKIGLLGSLGAELLLVSTPQVIEETGWHHLPVTAARPPFLNTEGHVTNDDSLVLLAESRRSPVLSEDYELLMHAKKKDLEYYNTLMILNYLLLKKRIFPQEYPLYLSRLKDCSRYNEKVMARGALVHESVLAYLDSHAPGR